MKLDSLQNPLNAQQKEAMRLREEERLTYREIAARMGVTQHRVRQVVAAARWRLADCAANGKDALCLVPARMRDFLEWHDLVKPTVLRAAIKSKRLMWDAKRMRLLLDGASPRNLGWQCWQVMCERAGLLRPKSPKKSDTR